MLKDNLPLFPDYDVHLPLEAMLHRPSYQMGNSKYLLRDLYVQYVEVRTPIFGMVFLPKDKLRRILIQFLLAVPEINEPVPLYTLLERNKHGADVGPTSKVPI